MEFVEKRVPVELWALEFAVHLLQRTYQLHPFPLGSSCF